MAFWENNANSCTTRNVFRRTLNSPVVLLIFCASDEHISSTAGLLSIRVFFCEKSKTDARFATSNGYPALRVLVVDQVVRTLIPRLAPQQLHFAFESICVRRSIQLAYNMGRKYHEGSDRSNRITADRSDRLPGARRHQEAFEFVSTLVHYRAQLSCSKPLTARRLHVLARRAIETTIEYTWCPTYP
jgi:hypothetical protein